MAEGSGLYKRLEDGYYDFLDGLDGRGIPVYKLVNAIEGMNIPSFPLAIALTVAVLLLLVWGFSGLVFAPQARLSLSVQDDSGFPVAGAAVNITPESGQGLPTQTTNTAGLVEFTVPMNRQLSIRVTKGGYQIAEETFSAAKAEEKYSITLELLAGALNKTIQLLKSGTSELLEGEVEIEFSCSGNENWSAVKTTLSGIIELEAPGDCGTLYAFPKNGYSAENDSFDFDADEKFTVYLSEETAGNGTVIASVGSKEGVPLAGIDISLASGAGVIFNTKQTLTSGRARFDKVPAGQYYVTAYDPSGTYAEYDSSDYGVFKDIAENATAEFDITLEKKVVGTIKIYVRDGATLAPVQNAKAALSKDGKQIKEEYTGEDGKITFYVGEQVPYDITIDKAGYLIENLGGIVPSESYREVLLTEATAENSNSLAVAVLDEKGRPVEDVRLRLKLAGDGTPVGDEIATGANGKAVFERVEEGTYYVYAFKPGYAEKNSANAAVSAREANSVEIRLPIGEGTLAITVLDEQMNGVPGAGVNVVNFYTGETMESQIANSQGFVEVKVRADKRVYVVASASGFLKYITIPVQAAKGTTQNIRVGLVKAVSALEVKFLGLYIGEETIADSDGMVNAGGRYTAKLQLRIPEHATFSEAGVHIRTGAADSGIMEKDYLYITNVRAAYSRILKGTSYNPPKGYSADAEHLTSGNAKWASLYFQNAGEGVYEVEADVQVSDAAVNGARLDIWYRGWGKAGSYARYPADAALGGNESSAEKQALYAQANNRQYAVGLASPCTSNFCSNFTIEDLGANIRTAVSDEYPARIAANYRLSFNISSISEGMLAAAELKIAEGSSSIAIGNYSITTAAGEIRGGNANGSELGVNVGDIRRDNVIQGTVDFSAKKEGVAVLEISLVSEAEKVYEKIIRVNVSAAKEMAVDILPKVLVPYVNNNILVRVGDAEEGGAIANASVTILKGGAIIANGETDSDGIFAYVLTAPSAGSVVGVAVEKNGYKTSEKEIAISEGILTFTPEKISELLTIGAEPSRDVLVVAANLTQIPLTIAEIKEGSEFRDYAGFGFSEGVEGGVIDANADMNVGFKLTIGGKGGEINEPKTINGFVDVYARNEEYGRTWLSQLPVQVRIGFGAEVDDATCFNVFPTEWKVFTSSGKKSISLALANHCTASSEEIALRKLQARVIAGSENELGKFRVGTDIQNSATIELTNAYQTIAELVPAGAENSATLEFQPADIASGSGEVVVEFRAFNYTEQGNEELKAKVKAELHIDNLAECVEVVQKRELVIESAAYNTGWGNYSNQFWNQSSGTTFNPYANNWDTTYRGTGMPNYIGTMGQLQATFPSQSWAQPNYASDYFSSGQNNAWNSAAYGGKTSFIIKNNCASEVEVSLDPDPALILQKKAVSIAPKDETEITVESAYMIGRYGIDIKAKVKGSSEAGIDVSTVYVTVENQFTKRYSDCISVSPARTIKFGGIIEKPQLLKISNTCYNEGVRLTPTTSGINFTGATTPVQSEGVGSEIVKQWSVVGAPQYESYAEGKVKETVTYEIVKNVAWRERVMQFVSEDNPVREAFNLRYELTAGYYAVKERTTLVVNFQTRYGTSQSIPFSMIIEDWLEAAPFVERFAPTYGDPNCGKGCINADAADFKKWYGRCLPKSRLIAKDEFSTAETGKGLLKVATMQRDKAGKTVEASAGAFGSADTISDLDPEPQEWVDVGNGAKAKFFISGDKKDIEMKLDLSGWDGNMLNEETKVYFTVRRLKPSYSPVMGFAMFRFCIEEMKGTDLGKVTGKKPEAGEKQKVEAPKQVEAGKTGKPALTGPAFQTYGFDKLLWDWRYDKISADACDAETNELYAEKAELKAKDLAGYDNPDNAYFCDAAQFTVALSRKYALVKKVADAVKSNACNISAGAANTGCGDKYKNSQEIWRFAVEHVLVEDDYKTFNHYFFLGKDGGLLERKQLAQSEAGETLEKLKQVMGVSNVTQEQQSMVFGNVLEILEQNQKTKTWFSDVVALVDDTGESAHKETYAKLGIEYNQTLKKWVMTLGEFYALNKGIKDAGNCPTSPCTIKVTLNGKTAEAAITTEFIRDLYVKSNFVVGLRNKDSMMPGEKEEVMLNGKYYGGVSDALAGYPNLLQFYLDNIGFNALLMEDGYSEDFVADFANVGEYSEHAITGLGFKGARGKSLAGTVVKAGMHSVVLKYDWGTAKTTGEIGEGKTLAQIDKESGDSKTAYASNVLFSMPFDGDVGLDDKDELNRIGYGVLLNPVGDEAKNARISVFNYGSLTDQPETKQTEFKVNSAGSNGDGIKRYDFHYKYDYESTKDGMILSIKGDEITFSPTDPIALRVQIENKGPIKKENVGMLYNISNKKWNLDKMEKPLDWVVKENSLNSANHPKDMIEGTMKWGISLKFGVKCDLTIDKPALVVKATEVGSALLDSIIYAPVNLIDDSVGSTMLEVFCKDDSVSITALDEKNKKLGDISETSLNGALGTRLSTHYTFKQLFEMIGERGTEINGEAGQHGGYVSVIIPPDGDGMELYWNEDEDSGIRNKLSAG